MKPLTHYSMLSYEQLPQETGQVSSGGGGGVFALPYRYVPLGFCTILVRKRV